MAVQSTFGASITTFVVFEHAERLCKAYEGRSKRCGRQSLMQLALYKPVYFLRCHPSLACNQSQSKEQSRAQMASILDL
eukprot:6187345-Pleurochrysis_carterae.AAC.1